MVVVSGAITESSRSTPAVGPPRKRSSRDRGRSARVGAGTMRPAITAKRLVEGKLFRHHALHRRAVRAGTPVSPASARPRIASATTLAMITTAPTYTRRPRNRTDGGVARRRHPRRPQQSPIRSIHSSDGGAISAPRGFLA